MDNRPKFSPKIIYLPKIVKFMYLSIYLSICDIYTYICRIYDMIIYSKNLAPTKKGKQRLF